MNNYLKALLAGLFVFSLAAGCKKKDETASQTVSPKSAGERGTSCDAKNDCGKDLSCIMGICQPAEFGIEATQKECYIVDCDTTDDCCGDRVTEAPAKCRDRDVYCNRLLPGCETDATSCYDASDCGGNATCVGTRYCNLRGTSCTDEADCAETCEFPVGLGGAASTGYCSIRGTTCSSDLDCTYASDSCGPGYCSCDNPNYQPSHSICSDPDCDDVCTLVCSDSKRCVEDTSCKSNADCVAGIRNKCSDELGECIECETDTDCDDPDDELDDDDECNEFGTCFRPCQGDAECPMFHVCAEDGGCDYVGCRTDQECVLLGQNAGLEDPRLLTCDEGEDGVGTCSIKCEIDAHCSFNEVCEGGTCKYIGCSEDSDCYSILNLNNWVRSEFTPWVPEAVCMEPVAAED